jgi:hypothetical protein
MGWPQSASMSAYALPFDQEWVSHFAGRKDLSWSGALKSVEATLPKEAKTNG